MSTSPYLDTPCMFGHPICLDAPCMFGHPSCMFGYPHMFGDPTCLDAPSKHTGDMQTCGASKSMRAYGHPLSLTKDAFFVLCMDRGISKHMGHTCSHACLDVPYVWTPQYVWIPPVCLDTPCMFGYPICLDNPMLWYPCMFGQPHILTYLLYVWMPPFV